MTYARRLDLERRFGAGEIRMLAPLPEGAEDIDAEGRFVDGDGTVLDPQPGDPRMAAALADADAEIDGKIAVAYDLPLPAGTWPLLVMIASDLARHRLYDDQSLEEPKNRAMKARSRLTGIQNGKSYLVNDAGARAPRRSAAAVTGAEPRFDRDAMRNV